MYGSFDFAKNYILENDCVLLRPLTEEDVVNLLEFSLRQPEIWAYSSQTCAGEDNLKQYIALALDNKQKMTEYPFIVFDKRMQQYAGSTRFYDIQLPNKTLQLGYTWYGKQFYGTGLNKHCKYLLLQFAFETMKIERVEFRADVNNARSIAAMKSIGCTVEGILRSSTIKRDGDRRDSIILSILKHEWESRIKKMLKEKLR